MWWKKNRWKIIVPVLVLIVLAASFWYGGSAPGAGGLVQDDSRIPSVVPAEPSAMPGGAPPDGQAQEVITGRPKAPAEAIPSHETASPYTDAKPASSPDNAEQPSSGPSAAPVTEPTPCPTMEVNPETGKDKYLTDPVPEGKPLPVEPQDVKIGTTAYTCTISISCATILDNLDLCDPEKVELVSEDGWILKPTQVTLYEGESVFNVLQRTCKQMKIHMEYESTPIYNSAYIEGIHNLYEFDVGELSGWMYKVNGWFPNYGCSRYQVKDGDVIEWVYTCDLGYDVGGGYALGT